MTARAPLPLSKPTQTASRAGKWGWLPGLSVIGSCGLLVIAYAHYSARAGAEWSSGIYWAGLLILIMPVAARLVSLEVARRERLGLVLFLGLSLYLVKVLHSPFGFTFPDELVHIYNVQAILEKQSLFMPNPLIAVTPFYPGLEIITAAVAGMTGLSPFYAGLIVIGCGRIVLMLSLFLLYELISQSPRVAGIGVLVFMGSSNFVYWSVQFSYESLSMPLAVLVIYLVARRSYTRESHQLTGLTLIVLLVLLTVVVTHHLTSYILLVFLAMLWIFLHFLRAPEKPVLSSAGIASIALMAAATWLAYVGSQTVDYISPVLLNAMQSMVNTVAGEAAGRELFTSEAGVVAPLWERMTGIGAVIVLLCGLPFGLFRFWERYRSNAFALVLALGGLLYFPVLALRFTPAGWETANRAANYLFVGLALIMAFAVAFLWSSRRIWRVKAIIFSLLATLILFGGLIAGWDPDLRLSRPFRIGYFDYWVEPQGVAAARWARSILGSSNRVAVDETNARLMLVYGNQYPLTGAVGGLRLMMLSEGFSESDLHILQSGNIRYIVFDKRMVSWDHMRGLYFDHTPYGRIPEDQLFPAEAYSQFDGLRYVSRLLDTGNIAIYDVGVLSGAKPIP